MDFRDLMMWRWPPREETAGQGEAMDPMRALQADINRAFEAFWRHVPAPSFRANWGMTLQATEPRIDLIETEREIEISAEMPGLEERDIEVSLSEDCITIKAEKLAGRDRQAGGYRINERLYGSVQRTIPLPARVDQDGVKATYKNGVLTISIPKIAGAEKDTKHIPVNKS
jgi:Molecular chaperone (small heat shock protein)